MNRIIATALLSGALAAPVSAQLANPSTAALGLGENYTAAARGYSAVTWNPAGLGLSGNPRLSLTVLTAGGIAGIGPVTLGDLKEWEGRLVPDNVKQQWLDDVEREGGQSGTGGGDVTWLALQAGRFAVQASSTARAVTDISPGFARLLLFGNADAEGNPRDIELSGSTMDGSAYTTVAGSWGAPVFEAAGGTIAVGVTAKYTRGHLLLVGAGSTGQASADPLEVRLSFPMIHSAVDDEEDGDEFDSNGGSGFGIDAAVAYESGRVALAATVRNVINTFEWDEPLLRYRAATLLFDGDETESGIDKQPVANAPAALRELLDERTFKPTIAAGAMLRHSDALLVTADARFGSSTALSPAPSSHVGAGIEYRVGGFLPLRAGAAWVQTGEDNAGFQLGGGAGLEVGGYTLAISALRRVTDLSTDTLFMLSLLSFGAR